VVERWLAIVAAGLAGCVLLVLSADAAAPGTPGRDHAAETLMLGLVNEERTARGLAPLTADDDVAEVAWAWSETMARTAHLEHNPDHPDEICCWALVAENVAFSEPRAYWLPGDPVERITRELHEALMESPGHRENILDPGVDQVGIGVHVDRDGTVWITQNFRRYASP
jgi:uncharacterized protein YkwD